MTMTGSLAAGTSGLPAHFRVVAPSRPKVLAEPAAPRTLAGGAAEADVPATYTLCYQEDGRGVEKRIRFEARSAAVALDIACGEAEGRWALLLCGEEILCRLEREAVGPGCLWVIDAALPNGESSDE